MSRIVDLEVRDIRFPTSLERDGSDAMNPGPDYSAAYVILSTDRPDGLEGHGLAFAIGRGTEVVVAAAMALRPLVAGQPVEAFTGAPGAFWRHLTGDSQLRWLGPEEGVIRRGRYQVPTAPRTSITMKLESLEAHSYPSGEIWRRIRPQEPDPAP